MNEVYVNMKEQNEWIKKHFDKDLVSVSDLIACIEDLDGELEMVKEEFEDYKSNVEENYKPLTPSEMGQNMYMGGNI